MKAMTENPQDRGAAAAKLAEAFGGRFSSGGDYDGMVVWLLPNDQAETDITIFLPRLAVGVGSTTYSQRIRRPGIWSPDVSRPRPAASGDGFCQISGVRRNPRPAERNYLFGCLAALSAQRPKGRRRQDWASSCRSRRRDCPDDRLAPASLVGPMSSGDERPVPSRLRKHRAIFSALGPVRYQSAVEIKPGSRCSLGSERNRVALRGH